jgi:hypothetical protein
MTEKRPILDGGYREEEMVVCDHCGNRAPVNLCKKFDASGEEEYYSDWRYICADCQRDPMGAWS